MLLIVGIHPDLMVTQKTIHERHAFITTCIINHDVGDGEMKLVLGTCLIEISEVDADPDLPILLDDRDNILPPSQDIAPFG